MKDGAAFSGGFRKLDVSGMSGNTVKLDRLYYKFPVGVRLHQPSLVLWPATPKAWA